MITFINKLLVMKEGIEKGKLYTNVNRKHFYWRDYQFSVSSS